MLRPFIATLLALSASAVSLAAQQPQAPDEAWRIISPPQASQVLARDGSLIGEIGKEYRLSVPLSTLPKYVGQAFIAVEDKRFYQHDGVDVVGVMGALKDAMLGDARGASTITQQLVGNMHPDIIDRRDRSLSRKLREQAAAREMEKHYTKAQILEAYLNQISFGHGWYGIEEGARHYFGKSASRLTLAEAATLAAMPRGPALYDPVAHPDRARDRRNTVLSLMADQGYITAAQAAAAKREPLNAVPGGGFSAPSNYFVDVVKVQAERAGVPIENGGYKVYTTLDPALQRAAVVSLVEGTAAVEARPGYNHPTYSNHPAGNTNYLQGAVVAIDPLSGDVRALVGGRNYAESQYDRAVNGLRQPGSAFKPIVYAEAISDSLAANAIVPDTAIAVPSDNGTVYRPQDDDGEWLGNITLREALAKSRNSVAVQLGIRFGMDSIVALAHRMGIDTPIAPYPSSAIGASAVHPLDLVAAYTTFANLGTSVSPRFIVRVDDHAGRTIWAPKPSASQLALDPRVAFIVRDMMRDVVERGTATSVRRYVPETIPVAGKTGTTNDNTDVWFVGMTPDLVAGVWLGFDTPKTIMPGAAGGSLAAPIWASMVSRWQRHDPPAWVAPAGIVTADLDRQTGAMADSTTPPDRRYTEYFLEGTEPLPLRFDPLGVFDAGAVAY